MLRLSLPVLNASFLVAIRLGTVLLFSPIQAIRQLPLSLRLLLVLMLSLFLVSHLSLAVNETNEIAMLVKALIEFVNGLSLSMSFYAAFTLFSIAGQLIDTQMGLNSLALFNPTDHAYDPLSSRLLTMLAVLFFFALNCHHALIQGLIYSFRSIPPGEFAFFKSFKLIIQQFSWMFSFALMIASPTLIGLLVIELASAILTRNTPQIATYFLVLPIKILFGFGLLALSMNYLNSLMDKLFKFYFRIWGELMA